MFKVPVRFSTAFAALGLSVALLGLAACGGSTNSGNTANESINKQDLVEAPSAAPQATGDIGTAVKTEGGLTIEITALAKIKPGKFAAGLVEGSINNGFTIKATNGGTAPADLTSLIITAGNGTEQTCVDVLDADNGFAGAPMDPLAPGATVEFKWAISCVGKAGSDVVIGIQVNGVNLVEAKGKLS